MTLRMTALAAALLGLLAAPQYASAQAAWEYSPYVVQVWVVQPTCPEWTANHAAELKQRFAQRAESVWGAVWKLSIADAPAEIRQPFAGGLLPLDFALLKASQAPLATADKLYFVQVQLVDGGWRVAALELDCRTRQWGEPLTAVAADQQQAAWAAWDLVGQAFTPLARIERVETLNVTARLRAGGLITADDSRAQVQPQQALRPIVRRNDRSGEPAKGGGVQAVGWTVLAVESRENSVLRCKMASAYRTPLPTRSGLRTERLALLVRPRHPETTILVRARDAQKTPLVGYSLYERPVGEEPAQLLGVSDWKGEVRLPALGGKAQVLLVRSGDQLLARLPLVPGGAARVEAPVVNDDGRLQAEGLVKAFQSRIMDVEARRQILAARIKLRLQDGKLTEAEALLEELRRIETRLDLNRYLGQQKVTSSDPVTQKRIDKLLSDAAALVAKFVDPELVTTLNRQIATAKNPPPAQPSPKTTTPKTPAASSPSQPPSAPAAPAAAPPAAPSALPAPPPPAAPKA